MNATDIASEEAGPWNPGIQSEIPAGLRHLCTIFRNENVATPVGTALELQSLTGIAASELVALRPQRLLLHELLIRVTADFSVPDGSRIGDLGINFREMTRRLLERHLAPQLTSIAGEFEQLRGRLRGSIEAAYDELLATPSPDATRAPRGRIGFFARRRVAQRPAVQAGIPSWGPAEIAKCEQRATTLAVSDPLGRASCRALARVLAGLFATHGRAWGARNTIVAIATDMAANSHGGEAIGRMIEPLLRRAAEQEGYSLLPHQEQPLVINTKGPSASGKSSLRPLQRTLAGQIGGRWSDFALISPDIWRKQLLDYDSLGAAYKYAGPFTADELQVVDQKLDRYMAAKHRRGDMTHLLIDRFRFDSFAPDSDEAGSNLLTRFGHTVYLFFMITPPQLLVERAWQRGLEFGRYKAVEDTLAHSVEAYSGMPDVFFTWVQRADKQIRFEFLDNSVRLGERPRTVAFGTNRTINVLDVGKMLDIVRFGRVNVAATEPAALYPDPGLLAPQHNLNFLRRCIGGFAELCFADQATGRIFLWMRAGRPCMVDRPALQAALENPDTGSALQAVAPEALDGAVSNASEPQFLRPSRGPVRPTTLGEWGSRAG